MIEVRSSRDQGRRVTVAVFFIAALQLFFGKRLPLCTRYFCTNVTFFDHATKYFRKSLKVLQKSKEKHEITPEITKHFARARKVVTNIRIFT